jgi:sigma-B regulation protein RsbU (phosphoserine phosphatase)
MSRRVDDLESLQRALDEGSWDVVLADYAMPHFNGIAALEAVKDSGLDLPFIMVSGTMTEETAVAAMKAGAHDYVMKDHLARLNPAVEREIHEAIVRQSQRLAEAAAAEALRLAKRREASVALLRELIQVSLHTLAQVSVEGVAWRMVEAAKELTGARTAAFGYRPVDGTFETFVERSEAGGRTEEARIVPEDLHTYFQQACDYVARGSEPGEFVGGPIGTLLLDRQGKANGILLVADPTQRELGEEDHALLSQLAGLASLGLQHIEARQEAEHRARHAESAEMEKEGLLVREMDLVEELAAANDKLQVQNEELLELQQETARLLEEKSSVLHRLQETLLDIPLELPGVRFAHLYRSATREAQVGGDFYDVFEVKGGRIGLLIGDVAGHGVEAARVATLVKDTVHAFAHQFRLPHLVLRETNRLLVEKNLLGFVSAFLGILDPATGAFTYSSAGHPAPLMALGGNVELLESIGPPLGVFPDARYRDHETVIQEGSLLLFYTDGVTEARQGDAFFGEEGLRASLERWSSHPIETMPAPLLEEALLFSGGLLTDDAAMLAVEYLGKTAGTKGGSTKTGSAKTGGTKTGST